MPGLFKMVLNPIKLSSTRKSTCLPITNTNIPTNMTDKTPILPDLTLKSHFGLVVRANVSKKVQKWRQRRDRVRDFLLRIRKNMFPKVLKRFYHKYGLKHVVLLAAVTVYSLLGALTFALLEKPAQLERFDLRDQILTTKRAEFTSGLFGKVFNDTSTFLLFIDDSQSRIISKIIREELIQYEDNIIQHLHFYKMKIEWDFGNALLYAWTLITTIGYGHIYPMTQGGRIATMVYAVIGIPLTVVCLQDLGKLLTRFMKFPWFQGKKWGRRMFQYCSKQTREQIAELEKKDRETLDVFDLPIPIAIGIVVGWILICSAVQLLWEKQWSFFEAFYFFFISLSTIGLGDIEPSEPKYLLYMFGNIIIGLSLVSMVINLISTRLERTYQAVDASQTTSPLSVQEILGRFKKPDDFEEGRLSIGSGKASILSSKSAPPLDSGVMSITSQHSGSLSSPRWARLKMLGSLKSSAYISKTSSQLASVDKLNKLASKSLPEVSQNDQDKNLDQNVKQDDEGSKSKEKQVNYHTKRRKNGTLLTYGSRKRSSIKNIKESSAQTPAAMWSDDACYQSGKQDATFLKSSVSFHNLSQGREHRGLADSTTSDQRQSVHYSHEDITGSGRRCAHYNVKQAAAQLKRELSMYDNWSPLRHEDMVAQINDEANMESLAR